MKRIMLWAVAVALLLGLTAGNAIAAEQTDLALTAVSLNRSDINQVDEIIYTVRWRLTVAEGTTVPPVPYTVSLVSAAEPRQVQGEPIVGTLPDPAQVDFVTGTLIAPSEGAYALLVQLDPENVLGEAANARSNNGNAAAPWTFDVQSALPPNILNVFAGLGMFAAVMAIVAMGAEVVIDTLRVALGLKSKVTAMEAVRRMEQKIPGQLEALGVTAEDQQAFRALLGELQETLATPLAAADAVVDLRSGLFQAAYQNLQEQWELGAASTPVAELTGRMADQARRTYVGALQTLLTTRLNLAPGFAASLTREMDAALKRYVQEKLTTAVAVTPAQMLGAVSQFLQVHNTRIVTHWLEARSQALIAQGQPAAKKLFEAQLEPFLLHDLGLGPETVGQIHLQLNYAVAFLAERAQAASQSYINGVKELLLAVEARRNETQSPFRKAWRKLRNASLPVWALLQGSLLAILLSALLVMWPGERSGLAQAILAALGLLIAVAVTALVQATFTATVERELLRRLSVPPGLPPRLPAATRENLLRLADPRFETNCEIRLRAQAMLRLGVGESAGEVAQALDVSQTTLYRWLIDYLIQIRLPLRERLTAPPEALEGAGSAPFSLHEKWTRRLLLFSLGDLLWALESASNFVRRQPNERGRVAEDVLEQLTNLNPINLAATLQDRDDKHRDEEASRLRLLRAIAFLIGLALAFLLQIDAAVLLERVVPGIADLVNFRDFFVWARVAAGNGTVSRLLVNPPAEAEILLVMRPGIILTGLAASAGSAYWHDVLDRLQASKKGAEAAARLLKQARDLPENEA
jgi:hypothetical protein